MDILTAIILGFVEGATEFIPVSSSGHLIVVREWLGVNTGDGLAFDAVLQLAASCALLVYFHKDIVGIMNTAWDFTWRKPIEEKDRTLLFGIVVGTVPAVIVGLLLEDYMESVFRNIDLVALVLVLGSILFWFAERFGKKDRTLTIGRALTIGFFQCLALVPGMSRSGATISGGLLSGLNQNDAVRFSFLLSIPIIFGAGLKKFIESRDLVFSSGEGMFFLVGSVVAFVTALFAISFLIKYLKNHGLGIFIWYRVGLATLLFLAF